MCMDFNSNWVIRARKDIPVWKVFRIKETGELYSPYMYVPIEKTLTKEARDFDVFGGYHCLPSREAALRYFEPLKRKAIRKLYIPKGTFYYRGTCDGNKVLGAFKLAKHPTKKGR